MTSRWREENYFRYARAHFALDALDSYAAVPDDPAGSSRIRRRRPRPPPSRPRRRRSRRPRPPARRSWPRCAAPPPDQHRDHEPDARPARAPRRGRPPRTQRHPAAAKATPAKIPLSQHSPGQVRLETETKLITHAIRMAACNAETILARALHGHYARAADEAFALIREALTATATSSTATASCTCGSTRSRAPAHPRPHRALPPAQHHPNPLPRHHAHPALRSQRTPWHCINEIARHLAIDTASMSSAGCDRAR